MTSGSMLQMLGITVFLLIILLVIAARTLRKGRKQHLEAPKYRMLDDD